MVQAHRIKAIALCGCTAVGKSETALKLAKRINGAIIGADSMQIYRGFDIGTGKLPLSERDGIEHSLIDIIDGDGEFSVGEYVSLAKREIERVCSNGKFPLIVGGTGLYVNSLFSGYNFADSPKNDALRKKLKLDSHFLGGRILNRILSETDPVSASAISSNDVKRTIRALEIFFSGGKNKTDAVKFEKPYDDLTIVLTLPRDILYDKINARVKKMFDDGLIEEAKRLMRYKGSQSMQAIGYKQIAECPFASREELEELVARKTRNYAKRQVTYFKNMKLNKVFIDARDYESVESCVLNFIGE